MKNLIVLLILFINSCLCFSQETKVSKLNIKTAPLQFIVPSIRTWNIGVEYFLDTRLKSSITFNPYLVYWNERSGDTTKIGRFANHRGIGATLSYKYYLFGFMPKSSMAQKGFYVSSFAQSEYLSVNFVNLKSSSGFIGLDGVEINTYENGRNTQTIFSLQTGFSIGYQWIWWKRIVFDIYGGVAYRYAKSTFQQHPSNGFYYPNSIDDEGRIFDKSYSGILPKLGFQLGLAF